MATDFPCIRSVKTAGPSSIAVTWANGKQDTIELIGWISTGGAILAPLADPATFNMPRVGEHGAAIEWGEDGGDLAIDAVHLDKIAKEQRGIDVTELAFWQTTNNFSNMEAAAFLGLGRSTWAAYKKGSTVPHTVLMTIRASQRDPVVIHAHFRPTKGKVRRPSNETKPRVKL
jgi:hypothetical protein